MPRLSRFTAALFALWFAAVLGDPGVLHTCAMHGGAHHAVPPAPAHAHGAHHAAGAATGHDTQDTHDTHDTHDTPASCTCVGQCCAAGVTVVPAVPAVVTASLVDAPHVAAAGAPAVVARAAAGLRLPFANGPPLA